MTKPQQSDRLVALVLTLLAISTPMQVNAQCNICDTVRALQQTPLLDVKHIARCETHC